MTELSSRMKEFEQVMSMFECLITGVQTPKFIASHPDRKFKKIVCTPDPRRFLSEREA